MPQNLLDNVFQSHRPNLQNAIRFICMGWLCQCLTEEANECSALLRGFFEWSVVLLVDFGILIVYLWFHCAEIAVKSQLTWLTICIRVILLSVSLWKRSLVESWCTVEIAAKGMAYAYRYTFLDRQDFIGYAMWLSWRAMAVRRIRLRCVRMTATCSERLYHKSQRRIVHSFCRAPHRPHELPISWFWLSDATLQ